MALDSRSLYFDVGIAYGVSIHFEAYLDLYFMVPLLGTLLWPDAKFLVESVNLDHKTTLLALLNF